MSLSMNQQVKDGEVLLQAEGLSKRFGGLQALSEVSFSIRKGDIYGLIGPNGAGKTTLFNVMTGLYIPESGRCTFAGRNLTDCKPHQIAEAGLPVPSRTSACSAACLPWKTS